MDIVKFKKWLIANGVEVLPVTNEYEEVRFKGKEVGVLYKSGKVANQYTRGALNCFTKNVKWDGKPINVGRLASYKRQKAQLLVRDGDKCFLCDEGLGEDITVEHLIALVNGGKNELSNMVLVHGNCNNELGNLPINEKVKMAIKRRIMKHMGINM